MPVLAKTLIVFTLVVAAGARKVPLGLAALVGGWAFALWQGLSPSEIALLTAREVLDPETLLLLSLVASIMALSEAMKKAGAMESFARSVRVVARSRTASIMLTPALIGTLPMPGGAAFSAPLVDSLDADRRLGADTLSAANYWFRHTLELWWPLFPAFILTSSLTGLPAPRLAALNLYTLPLLMILGRLFILRDGRGEETLASPAIEPRTAPIADLREILAGFAPLMIILGSYAALDAIWRAAGSAIRMDPSAAALTGRFFPIFAGLGMGALYIGRGARGKNVFRGSVNAGTFKLAAVVAGIRVFSALLEAGGAASTAAAELAAAGIPPLTVAAVLPLVSGIVTGVGFGYVGLSFPIVLGLYGGGAFGPMALEPVVVLAGACGFAGMMISPLHVCMVVSAEHFRIGLPRMIRRFAAPLGVFLACALVYAALLARAL